MIPRLEISLNVYILGTMIPENIVNTTLPSNLLLCVCMHGVCIHLGPNALVDTDLL